MFRFVLALCLAPTLLMALAKTEDPNWFSCDGDSDCIITDGICSSPTSINRKFKKEAQEYYHWRGTADSCEASKQLKVSPKSRCLDHKCSFKHP